MSNIPFFSICIPVYKNVEFLNRLLHSVFEQSFANYEVIITDDSPDDGLKQWLDANFEDARIKYFRNSVALGTPENWNQSIRKATGEWVKLMHDDDWFASKDALMKFYSATKQHQASFFFCGYQNVFVESDTIAEQFKFNGLRWKKIRQYPPNIYAQNIIGAPSTTLVKRDIGELYDSRMKWLVDIDYYIRVLTKHSAHYLPEVLVSVGQSSLQVTSYTHNNPSVELQEGLLLMSKLGESAFDHILYFDAWWRLLRNLNITSAGEVKSYAGVKQIPMALSRIILFQKWCSRRWLKFGLISKGMMFSCWLYHRAIKA